MARWNVDEALNQLRGDADGVRHEISKWGPGNRSLETLASVVGSLVCQVQEMSKRLQTLEDTHGRDLHDRLGPGADPGVRRGAGETEGA